MREHMIPITITIPFPYDRPDKNGNVYTKDAVETAVCSLRKNIPIIFRDNKCDAKPIGHTTGESHIVVWDDENQVCKITIDGVIYAGGTSCNIHHSKDRSALLFDITALGISAPADDEKILEVSK